MKKVDDENSGSSALPSKISSVSWPHLYLIVLCTVAYEDDALRPPFSCWDPLPHLQHCRTGCCQKQTGELKKELKPFIQLSEHIACHLCATFPHGQCLAVPDSHPAPANHRTWPWAVGLTLWEALGVNVWDRASTRCLCCTCLSPSTQFTFLLMCPWALDGHSSSGAIPWKPFPSPYCEKWCQAP